MSYSTYQKQAVFDWLKKTMSHPSADEVYEGVKAILPNIGIATIYRHLDELVKKGDIREILLSDRKKRYDGDISNHQHLICLQCGRIIDLRLTDLLNVDKAISEIKCHDVQEYRLDMVGVCVSCKK